MSVGYEIEAPAGTAVAPENPLSATAPTGTVTRDTASQRTGAGCMKCDAGAGNAAAYQVVGPSATGTFYLRAYMMFPSLPGADTRIMGWLSTNGISARLTTTGKLELWKNPATAAQIGSDSADTIQAGVYYRVELSWTISSGNITACELRLNGATVASTSSVSYTTGGVGPRLGWLTAPGANLVCYVDDVAYNDATGANNTAWPGAGQVVLLKPTADSAVGTGWTLGNGGAISGNNAAPVLDDVPPSGEADATSDTKQIRNATSNANTSYDATMTDYATAGIRANDTLNAVHSWVATAAPVSTSAKQGTVGIASNPTVANVSLGAGGTSGAFWSGTAAGAYPTGWKWSPGTISDRPTVTLATSPVMRITQVTSSTRVAIVCEMFMYAEFSYGPSDVPSDRRTRRQRVLARG